MEKPIDAHHQGDSVYRRVATIIKAAFKGDLARLPILTDPEDNINTLVDQYCQNLSDRVEKHAPLRSRMLRVRPHAPRFTEEAEEAKVKRRQYEAAVAGPTRMRVC